jgi:hypothetical protein
MFVFFILIVITVVCGHYWTILRELAVLIEEYMRVYMCELRERERQLAATECKFFVGNLE